MAQKLTDKLVKNLEPPKAGHHITYSTDIPGFGIRVTSTGTRSFILNYHIQMREWRYCWAFFGSSLRPLEEPMQALTHRKPQRVRPHLRDIGQTHV
ncbi:MAG TPA: Arm DNA-binding domain-containing protein [Alphaproteobacteria bacterium]|nr:Arm DNA-binding domain-containing protein [Alphaproteobacteria bacterium]